MCAGSAASLHRVGEGVTVVEVDHGWLYTPDNHEPGRPALLWIHGGGFVIGTPKDESAFASRAARELGISVLAVRYRLAPEHPAPAALEDCYAGLAWLSQQDGIDSTRIAIGGVSAGGGLAAGLAQIVLDRGEIPIVFQVLVYPMLDDKTCLRAELSARRIPVWDNASNRFGWASYLGAAPGGEGHSAPAVPARRGDLRGLAPAWIGVGTVDLFHDEDVEYARRLVEAGVACTLHLAVGGFHAFDRLAAKTSISKDFTAQQLSALRDAVQL